MTTDKRGVSALLLQRQLALRRYETAWMVPHKFRRAMVNLARKPLWGRRRSRRELGWGYSGRFAGKPATQGPKSSPRHRCHGERGGATGRIGMVVIADF